MSLESALASAIAPSLLEALSSEELGAMLRLKCVESKAGQLPSEDSLLARLARLSDERWAAVKPMVARGFGPNWSPLPASEVSLAADADAERRRRQTAAATAARAAKRQAGTLGNVAVANVPQRSKNVDSTLPTLIERSSSESARAPALQRSEPMSLNQSAPEGRLTDASATARALQRAADERWNRDLLNAASFPWAAEDRRVIPQDLVGRLATHPNSSPCRIAYALQQIAGMGTRSKPDEDPPNPLAVLITALGAQVKRPTPPWETPIAFLPVFDRMAQARHATRKAQSILDSIRNRQREAASIGAARAGASPLSG